MSQAEWIWKSIIQKGQQKNADFQDKLFLQPGASEEDLIQLQETLNVTIPKEMVEFYRIHNGQLWDIGGQCFIRNLTLSPISEIVENWHFLNEEFEGDELEASFDKEIKPLLWNPKWLPIASNGGGDYLCLDTDPTNEGQPGQVLYFWHDWGNRSVKAKSLFEFIQACLEEEDTED